MGHCFQIILISVLNDKLNLSDESTSNTKLGAENSVTKDLCSASQVENGALYVVATPIGNLGDISERVQSTLASVSKIAAEDTRRTRQLLSHIGVDTPCFSLHDHNERQKIEYLVQLLQSGESIALVSDAGTPLISDPGYPLVSELRARNMKVVAVPGPCALIAALSVAGLPTDRFRFEGFLPAKNAARLVRLQELMSEPTTMVFYESSHRILACIEDLLAVFGENRQAVIARELTKTFETVLQGTMSSLQSQLENDANQRKGEFVIMVRGATMDSAKLPSQAIRMAERLAEFMPGKQAAKITSEFTEGKKNDIYKYLLSLSTGDS